MKILICVKQLSSGGGVSYALLNMLKSPGMEKHDITLLVLESADELRKDLPKQVKIINAENRAGGYSSKLIIKKLLKQFKLFSLIDFTARLVVHKLTDSRYLTDKWIVKHITAPSESYDVAISYAMADAFTVAYTIQRVKAKHKIMWNHSNINMYKKKYISGLENFYKKYDRINCVSKKAADAMKRKYPVLSDKIKVAYNFVDEQRLKDSIGEPIDYTVPDGVTVLCTVGRIAPEKGFDLIPEAARILKEKNINFVWWIIGGVYNEELYNELKEQIEKNALENNVILLGEKHPPFPYVDRCDIYVQTSRYEGLPLTLMEARMLYKPIITTDFSGASELIINGENGSIVDFSGQAIAQKIIDYLNNPSLPEMYVRNLKEHTVMTKGQTFDKMIEC